MVGVTPSTGCVSTPADIGRDSTRLMIVPYWLRAASHNFDV